MFFCICVERYTIHSKPDFFINWFRIAPKKAPFPVTFDDDEYTALAMGTLAAAYRAAGKVKEAKELDKLFPTSFKAD